MVIQVTQNHDLWIMILILITTKLSVPPTPDLGLYFTAAEPSKSLLR